MADVYRLEKLTNIAPKHVIAYVENMQERGLSASTIKTDLSAVRFFHDQLPNAKHVLPQNEMLKLEQRVFGGVDKSWTETEFDNMISQCLWLNRHDYACIMHLGYYAALRIEECFKLDTSQAEKAVKT